ncbi:MAG: hypothetical protein V4737_16900 [Curtobacterium sp.]
MSRTRSRERRRLLEQLQTPPVRTVEEKTPARLLGTADIGNVISVRTAGQPLRYGPQHVTTGTLAGISPASPAMQDHYLRLTIARGTEQDTFTVELGAPVTVRRAA